jgi:hypothetical protein
MPDLFLARATCPAKSWALFFRSQSLGFERAPPPPLGSRLLFWWGQFPCRLQGELALPAWARAHRTSGAQPGEHSEQSQPCGLGEAPGFSPKKAIPITRETRRAFLEKPKEEGERKKHFFQTWKTQ